MGREERVLVRPVLVDHPAGSCREFGVLVVGERAVILTGRRRELLPLERDLGHQDVVIGAGPGCLLGGIRPVSGLRAARDGQGRQHEGKNEIFHEGARSDEGGTIPHRKAAT